MPSSVYLDVNNYTTSEYAVGTSGFVCNYPVQQDVWGESDNIAISITQGEKLVTIDSGLKDFTALLQGDQGVLLYPFISNGFENFILELDYVIDATTAMLKMPYYIGGG
jgi:hypothetical protein